MPPDSATRNVVVVVSDDRSEARLRVPSGAAGPPDARTCVQAIRAAGVRIDGEIETIVAEAVEALASGAHGDGFVVARSIPARHGVDEHVELTGGESGERCEQQAVDHYARSSLRCVRAGSVVGRVVPATAGTDGRDVLGARLPARPGRAELVTVDPTLQVSGEGALVARCDGVVHGRLGRVWIEPVLEIRDSIDFSTGNVTFEGERDVRFLVRRRIEAGVELSIRGARYAFTEVVRGPVLVGIDASKEAVFRTRTAGIQPLTTVAHRTLERRAA